MKKSFHWKNGAPFFMNALFLHFRQMSQVFTCFLLLGSSPLLACDFELSVRQDKLRLTLLNPSGNANDVYTWSVTGGIDAAGSAGNGANHIAAEIDLINNTLSTFTFSVNGTACYTKKIRMNFVCEMPGFTQNINLQDCTVSFTPYANPPIVKHHAWNFGDGSPEVYTAYPVHSFAQEEGTFEVTHTTIEWTGLEFTVDRCVQSVTIDCFPAGQASDTDDLNMHLSVSVAPNPASDRVWIQVQEGMAMPTQARLYHLSGALAQESQWTSNATAQPMEVQHLAAGYYLLEVLFENGRRTTTKMVISR